MALTKNKNVLQWVDEMVALTKPDQVVWIDGSKEQLDALTEEVTSLPEGNRDKMYKLNPDKLPGCPVPPHTSERRCSCRRPYLYLLQDKGRRWPDQQLDGSGRDEGEAHSAV